jgi:6,7-dimethyl-8-ribityllumazine synthase
MSRSARTKRKSSEPRARIAVIVSRYNASVTSRLRDGAVRAIAARLGSRSAVEVIPAPGAFELPAIALAAAETGRFDGIIALGCLVHGETLHDRYIANAVANGLVEVTMRTGVPAAFGVITAENAAQAAARAGGAKGKKGQEAADAVLDTLEAIDAVRHRAQREWESQLRAAPDKVRAMSLPAGRGRSRN